MYQTNDVSCRCQCPDSYHLQSAPNTALLTAVIIAGVTKIEDDVILWARVAINKDIIAGVTSMKAKKGQDRYER